MKQVLLAGAAMFCVATGPALAGGSGDAVNPRHFPSSEHPSWSPPMPPALHQFQRTVQRQTQTQTQQITASQTVINNVSAPSQTSPASQAPSSADPSSAYRNSGGGYYRGGNTPDVLAPSISGGNPCSVGLTLGGSGPNAGGSAGILWESTSCAQRQQAALLGNLGFTRAGIEYLCRTDKSMDTRYAMAAVGSPCDEDAKSWIKAWEAQGWHPPK